MSQCHAYVLNMEALTTTSVSTSRLALSVPSTRLSVTDGQYVKATRCEDDARTKSKLGPKTVIEPTTSRRGRHR
jgi:hypothetical protein